MDYEEREINWIAIFTKFVIGFLITIIIFWFISKIFGSKNKTKELNNNLHDISDFSVEYFKTVDLPQNNNEEFKITLEEMIEKDFFAFENKDNLKECDVKNSYSKITRKDNNYIVESKLKCSNKSKKVNRDFSIENCKNCNIEEKPLHEDNGKILFYEYVKEDISYGEWQEGNLQGNNIENKYEYYGVDYYTYYSLGYMPTDKSEFSYILKLNKVPNKKYYFVKEDNSSFYNFNDKSKYIKEKNLELESQKLKLPKDISKYILNDNNFTYKLYPYYSGNNFYIRISIKVRDSNGISSYYDKNIDKEIYLVPIKINLKFESNELSKNKPKGKYETVSYYRYINKNTDIKWSSDEYLEGYIKTGKTELR